MSDRKTQSNVAVAGIGDPGSFIRSLPVLAAIAASDAAGLPFLSRVAVLLPLLSPPGVPAVFVAR